ncbi:MAG: NUDIX hydrolase [Nitrospiraceae bacterium]|nr:NUDIX hydrolase [Nitrospiraceae bacterium]
MTDATVVPKPAVIGVVVRNGQVLSVRRSNPPDTGKWGFPDGKIKRGETIHAAAVREVEEETGLQVRPLDVLTALDVLNHDERGSLRFRYVLIAVLCEWVAGTVSPADDVSDAPWVEMSTINPCGLDTSASVSSVTTLAGRWRSRE